VCLRRLRLPPWHSLQESRKAEILSAIRACGTDCREKADAVASLAYGLSKTERKTISGRVG